MVNIDHDAAMLPEAAARDEIIEIGRRLYAKDLIAAGDGNISVRLGPDRVLVTRSGAHKGFLQAEDVVTVDLAGHPTGRRSAAPSSEFAMHALCYAERPDCAAVVHAHPPTAVGMALAGVPFTQCVLSEACLTLGDVPTAPYSTPTTDEVPRVLQEYVRRANAIIMNRHGALCLGRTLDEAWRRMETLEHTARTLLSAHLLGEVTPLPAGDVKKLAEVARAFGIDQPRQPGTASSSSQRPATKADEEDVERVVAAVVARLRR